MVVRRRPRSGGIHRRGASNTSPAVRLAPDDRSVIDSAGSAAFLPCLQQAYRGPRDRAGACEAGGAYGRCSDRADLEPPTPFSSTDHMDVLRVARRRGQPTRPGSSSTLDFLPVFSPDSRQRGLLAHPAGSYRAHTSARLGRARAMFGWARWHSAPIITPPGQERKCPPSGLRQWDLLTVTPDADRPS